MTETIVIGAGCFWCSEAVFSRVQGIVSVTAGYAGGWTKSPTYEEVCTGETGHAEVILVEYNPEQVTLERLLDLFFKTHDPTSKNRQGNDVGSQYRSAVYYTTDAQSVIIENAIKDEQRKREKSIVTEVKRLDTFYPAEIDHQEYFACNPFHPYCLLVIMPKLKKMEKEIKK